MIVSEVNSPSEHIAWNPAFPFNVMPHSGNKMGDTWVVGETPWVWIWAPGANRADWMEERKELQRRHYNLLAMTPGKVSKGLSFLPGHRWHRLADQKHSVFVRFGDGDLRSKNRLPNRSCPTVAFGVKSEVRGGRDRHCA